MIKHIFSILFLSLFLSGCSSNPDNSTISELPVIDLNKEYPVKRMDIHEIADIDYVPLETTENSLMQAGVTHTISDKYIVVFDILQQKLHCFNRQGTYINTIYKFGQGSEEYYGIVLFDVDLKKEELYAYGNIQQKISVYSFSGDFKRSFKFPLGKERYVFDALYDYDSDYLITFNDSDWPDPDEKYRLKADPTPYYLINKKNGTLKLINERLRIGNPVPQIFNIVEGQNGFHSPSEGFHYSYMLKNETDFLIVNNALDTLYNFADHKLDPVMLRTPSTLSMNPAVVIAPCVYTDKFFIYKKLTMDYELGKKYDFDDRRGPAYIVDRKTKEVFQLNLYDSLLDPDIDIKDKRELMTAFPGNGNIQSMHTKNQASAFYRTSFLKEKLSAGTLQGKLKEVASRLKEDDNNVVIIYKFK